MLEKLSQLFANFKKKSNPNNDISDHSVTIHFNYGSTDLQPLYELEDKLEEAITAASVGEFDGHDIAADGSDGYLYMYGSNADKILEVIKPILSSYSFMNDSQITVTKS